MFTVALNPSHATPKTTPTIQASEAAQMAASRILGAVTASAARLYAASAKVATPSSPLPLTAAV